MLVSPRSVYFAVCNMHVRTRERNVAWPPAVRERAYMYAQCEPLCEPRGIALAHLACDAESNPGTSEPETLLDLCKLHAEARDLCFPFLLQTARVRLQTVMVGRQVNMETANNNRRGAERVRVLEPARARA